MAAENGTMQGVDLDRIDGFLRSLSTKGYRLEQELQKLRQINQEYQLDARAARVRPVAAAPTTQRGSNGTGHGAAQAASTAAATVAAAGGSSGSDAASDRKEANKLRKKQRQFEKQKRKQQMMDDAQASYERGQASSGAEITPANGVQQTSPQYSRPGTTTSRAISDTALLGENGQPLTPAEFYEFMMFVQAQAQLAVPSQNGPPATTAQSNGPVPPAMQVAAPTSASAPSAPVVSSAPSAPPTKPEATRTSPAQTQTTPSYEYQRPSVPDKACTRCGTNHWFFGPKATPCVPPLCHDCNRRHWQSGPSREPCSGTGNATGAQTTGNGASAKQATEQHRSGSKPPAPSPAGEQIIERIYIDDQGRQVIERTIPAKVAQEWQRSVEQQQQQQQQQQQSPTQLQQQQSYQQPAPDSDRYSPTSPGFDRQGTWRASVAPTSPNLLARQGSVVPPIATSFQRGFSQQLPDGYWEQPASPAVYQDPRHNATHGEYTYAQQSPMPGMPTSPGFAQSGWPPEEYVP